VRLRSNTNDQNWLKMTADDCERDVWNGILNTVPLCIQQHNFGDGIFKSDHRSYRMTKNFSRTIGFIVTAMTMHGAAWAESPEGPVEMLKEPVVRQASVDPTGHPFASMAGAWTGGGTIELLNDIKETLRCRASYTHGVPNSSLSLSIRCASDNYKFELASNVVERRGQISGTWSESAYNVSGSISGRIAGNNVIAVAKGESFNADLSVTTTANRQMVTITPKATYVVSVKVALNRGR
jgi:hypothetical protein